MGGQQMRLAELSGEHAVPRTAGPDGATGYRTIRVGPYLVRPGARSLEREGEPIDLGSRAFDLLMVLLRSRGNIVSKEEIMRYVWPSTFVEDANLRVQMACLRRVLGRDGDLIKTVPGRGYLAIAEEEECASHAPRC